MKKHVHVFVSGRFDILHAGHVQFLREAKKLGDELTVCFAAAEVLWAHKGRRSLPDEQKQAVLESLRMVDRVVVGRGATPGLDFEEHFLRLKPDTLAVTDDDKYADVQRELCTRAGAEYRVLKKTPPGVKALSTTEIVRFIRAGGSAAAGRFRRRLARRASACPTRRVCRQLRDISPGLPSPVDLSQQFGLGRQRCILPATWRRRRPCRTGLGRGLAGSGRHPRDGPVRLEKRSDARTRLQAQRRDAFRADGSHVDGTVARYAQPDRKGPRLRPDRSSGAYGTNGRCCRTPLNCWLTLCGSPTPFSLTRACNRCRNTPSPGSTAAEDGADMPCISLGRRLERDKFVAAVDGIAIEPYLRAVT